MLPVLFSIGPLTITSFGFFTVLACLVSLYIIWRLSIVYNYDKESVLDLFLLTSLVALIGSRLSYVLLNLSYFNSLVSVFSIFQNPGFYLWGGIFSSILFLVIFLRRRKASFWQVTDIASVGLFVALSVGSLGCLMAGCQSGYPSNLFIAVPQAGLIENRFPIQIVEGFIYLLLSIKLYRESLKFHLTGTITAQAIIYLSITKFFVDFFRSDVFRNYLFLSAGQIISFSLFIIGLATYFLITKTSPITAIKNLYFKIKTPNQRTKTYRQISGNISHSMNDFKKGLTKNPSKVFRRFNIHRNPRSF